MSRDSHAGTHLDALHSCRAMSTVLSPRGLARRALSTTARQKFPLGAPTWPDTISRPLPEREIGVDYPTDWARRYPVRLARALLLDNVTRPLSHLVAAPEVRGQETLELVRPPAIFVANHTSHVDTPLLLSVLPVRFRHRTVVAAAADHFFDRRWKAHLWAFALAAIPIERHRVNRRSAEVAMQLLDDGWNLVIYPEGGRSRDGWFGEFKGGAAYLARHSGRPLVPVHIDGTFRILPRGSTRLRRSHTTITFGSPLLPVEGEDARHLAGRIQKSLAVLADEVRSDFWSARLRASSGTTPAPEGPGASPWRRAWSLPPDQDGEVDEGRWAVRRRPGPVRLLRNRARGDREAS
jgi:1-acyl-sn-glycerol-3-phosphate acyltransferase